MEARVVGYEWHNFVGDDLFCQGVLGTSEGDRCLAPRGANIHSDENKPDSIRALEKQSSFSTQVGGSHYSRYKIQPLEFITANNLDFVQGNVVKYVVRYKDKGGIEDLKKAKHYLDLLIELEEKKNES